MNGIRTLTPLVMAALTLCLVPAGQAVAASYQTAEMTSFEDGGPAPGAATLVRTRNSVTANLSMSGLDSRSAYTVWWVIWNDPSVCVDGCGEDDLFAAGNVVFYAGGFISSKGGTANIQLSASAGGTPDGMDNFTAPSGLARGRGMKAEVHLVARRHGKPKRGSVGIQVGSFEPHAALGGACPDTKCFDQFAFVFLPAK